MDEETPKRPRFFRVGRHNRRTIYEQETPQDTEGTYIGSLDTPELSAMAVTGMNHQQPPCLQYESGLAHGHAGAAEAIAQLLSDLHRHGDPHGLLPGVRAAQAALMPSAPTGRQQDADKGADKMRTLPPPPHPRPQF